MLSTGLILAAILAAGGLWFHRKAPEPPKPFDPAERLALVEKSLEQASPMALWDMFVTIYEPAAKRGLQKAETTADRNAAAEIVLCHTYRNRLWIAAGAVAIGTLALFPLLPRAVNPSS